MGKLIFGIFFIGIICLLVIAMLVGLVCLKYWYDGYVERRNEKHTAILSIAENTKKGKK